MKFKNDKEKGECVCARAPACVCCVCLLPVGCYAVTSEEEPACVSVFNESISSASSGRKYFSRLLVCLCVCVRACACVSVCVCVQVESKCKSELLHFYALFTQ